MKINRYLVLLFTFVILNTGLAQKEYYYQWSKKMSQEAEYAALVIANNYYENNGNLTNPIPTANKLLPILKDLGFDVLMGLDLDRKQMEKAILDFSKEFANYKAIMVFYLGHGFEINGKNYLIPIDANPEGADEIGNHAIEVDYLLKKIHNEDIEKVVVLDACRNNPFTRSWSAKDRSRLVGGFDDIVAPVNAEIFFTTQKKATVRDDNPYMDYFMEEMNLGGCIEDMVRKVSKKIALNDKKQVPAKYGQLLNEMCFSKKEKTEFSDSTLNAPSFQGQLEPPSIKENSYQSEKPLSKKNKKFQFNIGLSTYSFKEAYSESTDCGCFVLDGQTYQDINTFLSDANFSRVFEYQQFDDVNETTTTYLELGYLGSKDLTRITEFNLSMEYYVLPYLSVGTEFSFSLGEYTYSTVNTKFIDYWNADTDIFTLINTESHNSSYKRLLFYVSGDPLKYLINNFKEKPYGLKVQPGFSVPILGSNSSGLSLGVLPYLKIPSGDNLSLFVSLEARGFFNFKDNNIKIRNSLDTNFEFYDGQIHTEFQETRNTNGVNRTYLGVKVGLLF